jgi:iron complex outermembrane receptor protein
MYEPTPAVEIDLRLQHVDSVHHDTDLNRYNLMTARIGWMPNDKTTLSLVGQNLLENRHAEFSDIEIERSVHLQVSLTF